MPSTEELSRRLEALEQRPLTRDFKLTTTVGTAIAIGAAVVSATLTYASFSQKISSLEERLASMPLTEMSKRVQFLDCREREHTSAARNIFADMKQILSGLNEDYATLRVKMNDQIENQQDQLVNNCGARP